MTLTPDRLEEIARSVEAGTMSLAQLQSAGLFQTYEGNDLLTNTDAALNAICKPLEWRISFLRTDQYMTGGVDACISLDGLETLYYGFSDAPTKSIIAALIRAGEGQRKGKENV